MHHLQVVSVLGGGGGGYFHEDVLCNVWTRACNIAGIHGDHNVCVISGRGVRVLVSLNFVLDPCMA